MVRIAEFRDNHHAPLRNRSALPRLLRGRTARRRHRGQRRRSRRAGRV